MPLDSLQPLCELPLANVMWGNQVKVVNAIVATFVAATLTSCALSKDEFDFLHTTMEGSPKIRQNIIKECEAKTYSKDTLHQFSLLMNVSESSARTVYCHRLHDAIADGRVSYADYKSLSNVPSPSFIKVMQGR